MNSFWLVIGSGLRMLSIIKSSSRRRLKRKNNWTWGSMIRFRSWMTSLTSSSMTLKREGLEVMSSVRISNRGGRKPCRSSIRRRKSVRKSFQKKWGSFNSSIKSKSTNGRILIQILEEIQSNSLFRKTNNWRIENKSWPKKSNLCKNNSWSFRTTKGPWT